MNDSAHAPHPASDAGGTPRNVVWKIVVAATVTGLILMLPDVDGLPPAGKRMAAIFALAVILWATEVIPIAVTALVAVVLQPIFRAGDLHAAFTAFVSPVFFFVLAMFCLQSRSSIPASIGASHSGSCDAPAPTADASSWP